MDLDSDIDHLTPHIAKKTIEGAKKVNGNSYLLSGAGSVVCIAAGFFLLDDAYNNSAYEPHTKTIAKAIAGIALIVFGVLLLATIPHNYHHYNTVYLPKLEAIANS